MAQRKPLTPEQKQALVDRLAKAREAKKAMNVSTPVVTPVVATPEVKTERPHIVRIWSDKELMADLDNYDEDLISFVKKHTLNHTANRDSLSRVIGLSITEIKEIEDKELGFVFPQD